MKLYVVVDLLVSNDVKELTFKSLHFSDFYHLLLLKHLCQTSFCVDPKHPSRILFINVNSLLSEVQEVQVKVKLFLTLHGINLLFLGVTMLFMPLFLWDIYGISLSTNGEWLARFAACLIIGNALFSFLIHNAMWPVVRPFLLVQMWNWAAVLVVFMLMQFNGITNAMNWTNIGLCLFWLIIWGYFLFVQPHPKFTMKPA